MKAAERAKIFCDGAFGPLGVDTKPYTAIIAELIEGAENEQITGLRPLLTELRDYVKEGITATRQCSEELPGYKTEVAEQHLAHLESMFDRLNNVIHRK